MKKDVKVKCDVVTCKNNNSKYCSLNELNISCICDSYDCHSKKETICSSFSQK